jgi:glutamate-ammonia-ligase adenylyltransferase
MSGWAFLDNIGARLKASTQPALPIPFAPNEGNLALSSMLTQPSTTENLAWQAHPITLPLIHAMAGNSPYLSRLMQRQSAFFVDVCRHSPEEMLSRVLHDMHQWSVDAMSQAEMMRHLRVAKQQVALLSAMADIAGVWEVMTVTRALSDFADAAIQKATDFLLLQAHRKNELALIDVATPQAGSGLLVLGMGKLGAHELNYSSDIDLIILFDSETAPYVGSKNVQYFFTKFGQDITTLLQERTVDGYVFRTDLRLRPDPRSTPLAVRLDSAINYYENLGQNWERAAMIKARQIAGDTKTGAYFNEHMVPYIWRKHLDFASIADIHSIKRQMNTRVGQKMAIGGHNIKLGRGGIREIEFYVQTQQLVWGGRMPQLRTQPTLDTLQGLVQAGHVTAENAEIMATSYRFLRRVEHYLQMIDDQQTHTLPETDEELLRLAMFLGYSGIFDFCKELLCYCNIVHEIYTDSMEGTPPLSVDGNLVFTGVEADPETLKTLSKLGYKQAVSVSDIIQSWHRGSRRATRTKRARQLLTEMIPALLTTFSDTANPDNAFMRFDDFITNLPAGVQIFSLLNARPEILELLAHILGSAPALAEILSKQPHLLDAVVQGDFYHALPPRAQLEYELREKLHFAQDYEESLRILRTYKNERQFQAGVQMLKGLGSASHISHFLSDLAEEICGQLIRVTQEEFARTHGHIHPSESAIIAMGKLGSRELTFGSDLDVVFIYSGDDITLHSDGPKSVDLKTYYNRLCSRILNGFTLLTKEGSLYDVDTRLRPSGGDSTVATHIDAFDIYFEKTAWVFEYMALTRARVICSSQDELNASLSQMIRKHLSRAHEPKELAAEVRRMREKMIEKNHSDNPWHIKLVRGGSVDIDFFAQYLLLRHAHLHPSLIQTNSANIFAAAASAEILDYVLAEKLIEAHRFLSDLLSFLRLTSPNSLIEISTPVGLKNLLVERFEMKDFESLEAKLIATETFVFDYYKKMESF